jgi:PAS domain S-box-containing protein
MTRAKSVQILLLLSFLVCLFSCIVAYKGFRDKQTAQYWVDHTYSVLDQSMVLLATYKDIEISYRSFKVTHDTGFLAQYQAVVGRSRKMLKHIRTLTLDNPDQTTLIDEAISPFIQGRINSIDRSINSSDTTLQALFLRNKDYHAEMQTLVSTLTGREKELLNMRQQELMRATLFTEWWMYTSFALIAVTTLLAFFTIVRVQKQNDQLFHSVREVNESLESRVAEQTAEIMKSNQSLYRRNQELATMNEELQASEEEVKANLEYISSLKTDLEVKEKLYRLLAENSQDMITIVGLDSRIEFVSPASFQILQYQPSELLGKKGFELVCEEDAARVTNEMMAVKETGERVSDFQFRMKRKDGALVWVESQTTPIFNEQGDVIKRQTSVREITERKKAETEILVAKEKAEEATLAKTQFLSTMSHEIRTPMNAVIGLTNILLQNNPREDQRENLNLLKFSGENLLTIINDILDLNKIEAGKISLEDINYNLHELLGNIIQVHEQKASEKGLRLHFNFVKGTPSVVKGDPVRINQIITNLLSNAIKFTEKGYVQLSVSGKSLGEKLHKINFTIKDSGIGIAADKLDYIFERFSQANADTTRKFGGTGLGLAITRHLVEMMGGTVDVQSMPGYGSTFNIEIEVAEGTADPLAYPEPPQKKTLGTPSNGDARVLIAEDNRVNQIVVYNFLNNWGIKTDFASNGLEALELIQSKSYKLILMDLQMPEMDGYTAARKIRSMDDPYFKNIPIIALTASAMIEIKQKAFDTGMNDYISKPFDPDDLRKKIFHFLEMPVVNDSFGKSWSDNFNLYTEGNPELKRELADVLSKNITELQSAVDNILNPDGLETYKRVVHKVKTTLSFLGDKEFENIVNEIPDVLAQDNDAALKDLVNQFTVLSRRLLAGLSEEIAS